MSDTLNPSPHDSAQTETHPAFGLSGGTIGWSRLLEPLGEGGMGKVWLAEQLQPRRRQVALKIIKPGMDTRSGRRAFEAERQALALMDHPNIARVFDAGPRTRPALLRRWSSAAAIDHGVCDRNDSRSANGSSCSSQVCRSGAARAPEGHHSPRSEALERLVTLQDDRPVPKVIDFGVAKATSAAH